MVGMRVVQGPWRLAAKYHLVDADHQGAQLQALAHPRLEVAGCMQFFVQPGFFESICIRRQFVLLAVRAERVECCIGGQHACLDRGMAALDAAGVQEAGVATDQCAAGEGELGQRLQPAGRDCTRAVGNALGMFKERPDRRMGLVALEFFIRRQPRVLVAEADHVADRHLVVLEVIQERAAIGIAGERPAGSVDHQARLVHLRIDLPQFLDADTVGLRITVLVEVEFLHQLLAEMAARAFGEQRVFRMQLHAKLECRRRYPMPVDAHVAGGDTPDRSGVVVQYFGGRKTGKNFDAQCFGLLPEPAHDVGQRDHVIAVILEAVRQHPVRRLVGFGFGQKQETVLADRHVQRCAAFLPVRKKFGQRLRVHHRAGQDMRAEFTAFFQHADGDFVALCGSSLLDPDGS